MKTEEYESINLIIRRGSLKQRFVCFVIGLFCTITSIEQYSTNFLTPYQEFWCSVPQIQNCSNEKQKELVLPQIFSEKSQDYCTVINLNWSYIETLCDFEDYVKLSERGNIKCETGFQFNSRIFTLTATSRFQLVCDNAWVLELISPVFLASFIIGEFLSGFISDGYGRKFSLLIFSVIHTFGGIFVSFSPNVWLFLAGRILEGISLRGMALSALTLLVELVPTNRKEYASMIYELNYCIGALLVICLSYFIRDYRWLQLSTSLLYCPLIFFWSLIPESPLWLASKGYYDKAAKELNRLSLWANMPIDERLFEDHLKSKEIGFETQISPQAIYMNKTNLSICEMFNHKKLVIYIIALSLGYLGAMSSFLGATLNMELLFGDFYINLAVSGLLDLSAVLVFCFVFDKFGRKTMILTLLLLQILIHLTQIILTLLPGFELATTIVALICKLMPICMIMLLNVTAVDLFPTNLRQQALGYSMGFAGIFVCFCSIIGGKLKLIWAPIPNIVFGFLIFLSFVAFLFVPETKNRKIPDTLEETLGKSSKCTQKRHISNILPPDDYIHNSEFIGIYRYFGK